jgi:hypothetical protein
VEVIIDHSRTPEGGVNPLKNLVIVTNNPLVVEKCTDSRKVDESPVEVVEEASRMLLEGYSLFGSPLPPNGRLMKNPYRSIALMEEKGRIKVERDFLLLEKARQRLSGMPFLSREGKRGEDPAFMDLALLEAGLGSSMKGKTLPG